MVRLLTTYYIDKSIARDLEYKECINNNLMNPLIDEVHILTDDTRVTKSIISNEIKGLDLLPNRPTYKDYFRYANNLINDDNSNDITIISNTDIYITEANIKKIIDNLRPDCCYALTRWDVNIHKQKILFDRPDSQDTWVFRGKIKDVNGGEFALGIPGCDNRIAYDLKESGYNVLNPSRDVMTEHIHNSMVRNYITERVTAIPRPYHLIHPTFL